MAGCCQACSRSAPTGMQIRKVSCSRFIHALLCLCVGSCSVLWQGQLCGPVVSRPLQISAANSFSDGTLCQFWDLPDVNFFGSHFCIIPTVVEPLIFSLHPVGLTNWGTRCPTRSMWRTSSWTLPALMSTLRTGAPPGLAAAESSLLLHCSVAWCAAQHCMRHLSPPPEIMVFMVPHIVAASRALYMCAQQT